MRESGAAGGRRWAFTSGLAPQACEGERAVAVVVAHPWSLDFPVLRTKSLNSSYVMRPEPSSSIFLKILNHSFCCLGSSFELSFCESATTSS